jgi:predicted nucleotidyltransferase
VVDLKAVVTDVRDTLVAELDEYLLSLYLFGSAARGQHAPGRSDIDLLLVVAPAMPLAAARSAYRSLWQRYADTLGHGPLVATPDDLALHLELIPSFHRALLTDAIRLHGEPVLKHLPPPPPPDPIKHAAYVAARAITLASALTSEALPPDKVQRLTWGLNRLAWRVTDIQYGRALTPLEAILTLHAKLREFAAEMPQFGWHGTPPSGDVPSLLPGCRAFYQREQFLITVLERVDEETLSDVDWDQVSAAAQDAHALFGMATPWQLRLVAKQMWVDSLYFAGFEHIWGADILGDMKADEATLLRQLARSASEQRVEKVPSTYLYIEEAAVPKLIHDSQNMLLNAGLRAELFARFAGREFDLSAWTAPGRETPQPERVEALWQRWRELAAHYTRLWHEARSRAPFAD